MYSNWFAVGDIVEVISVDNRKYNKHIPIRIGAFCCVVEQPNTDFPQDAIQVSMGFGRGELDSKIVKKL
jgi:hypothetical protein